MLSSALLRGSGALGEARRRLLQVRVLPRAQRLCQAQVSVRQGSGDRMSEKRMTPSAV